MADVITRLQLENAARDADDLGLIVNAPADYEGTGLVETRFGGPVKTIQKVLEDAGGSFVPEPGTLTDPMFSNALWASMALVVPTIAAIKALDTARYKIVYLNAAGKEGFFKWQAGDFAAKVAIDTKEGVYIKSTPIAATAGCWVRVHNMTFDVRWFDAKLDNANDDTASINCAINVASSFANTPYSTRAEVYMPPGFICRTNGQINFHTPIKVNFRSTIFYYGTSGVAIFFHEAPPAIYASEWDVYLNGLSASPGIGGFPSSVDTGGPTGIVMRAFTFSKFECHVISGFSNIGLQLDGRGITYPGGLGQVIQHNEFRLGQVVNCGIGIWAFSIDAATSSVQANRFFIQNIYQNWVNILTGDATYKATTSNTWDINAMDNCTAVGIDSWSIYDTFYVGFAGEPGTTLRRNAGSDYNKYEFNNNLSTDIVINEAGGGKHDDLRCKSPSNLPLTGFGVTNGADNQNNYGVPITVYVPVSGGGTYQLYLLGPDNTGINTPNMVANGGICTINCKAGWKWKLFTTGGSVTYGAASIVAA